MPTAEIQASIASLTQIGIGAVRTRPCFPPQIDNAPAAVALLDVCEGQRRHLGSAKPAP